MVSHPGPVAHPCTAGVHLINATYLSLSATCLAAAMRCSALRLQSLSPLSGPALRSEVKTINDILPVQYWSVSSSGGSSSLEATYVLKNHRKTWEFLNSAAASSHKLRHHPTITTTYNKVHFSITTHDAGNTITYNDTKLATAIHNIYADSYAETSPLERNPASTTMNEGLRIIDKLTKREQTT